MALRCPKCGTQIEAGARFCGACGARLEPKAAAPPPQVDDLSKTLPSAMPPMMLDEAPASRSSSSAAAPRPSAAAPPAARAPSPAPRGSVGAPAPAVVQAKTSSSSSGAGAAGPASAAKAKPRAPLRSLDSLIGKTLNGRYVVEKKIGEGGFGAVFRGKQVGTGREVALKLLHPHNISDQTVVARFRREAEACSKLRDVHTVTIYDFDETEDGVLYLAMEYLRGKSLHQLQRAEGPLDPIRVLKIVDQVAQALGEAHQLGIVHRDMKPENIVVEPRGEDDLVKVLDFGIAKVIGGSADGKPAPALTAVGQTLGTLEFMSPEQLRGGKIDGRSDLYALGIMCYEMLTNELPFKNAKSPTEVIKFHMQEPAPPPSKLKPELKIPSFVDQVVLKMVAKSPDDRHADAADLREHIRRALAGGGGLGDKLRGLFKRK